MIEYGEMALAVRRGIAESEQPPMSRERFRQEAVLALVRDTAYGTHEWPHNVVHDAEQITRAVFGEEDGDG